MVDSDNRSDDDPARLAAETSPDALLLVDENGTTVYANAAARVLFARNLLGEPIGELVQVEGPPLSQLIGSAGMARRATAVTANGEIEEVDLTIGGMSDGTVAITLRPQLDPGVSTVELLRRATHDDLTQLANRASFVERVTQDTRNGDRLGHALIMLDLDGFKLVNDGYGHEIGDQVLIETAHRLRMSCRPDDLVARFGGDEFSLWCPGLCDDDGIRAFVHRLLEAIEQPIPIASTVSSVSASVGVVVTTDSLIEISDLLSKADAAMYRAKSLGAGRHVVYDDDIGRDLVRARTLERSLAEAIANDRLELHYQATVDLVSGEAVGAEALIRWPHPHLGLVTPHELIEVATRTHLHTSLTSWVIEAAISELARWNRVLADPIGVSVNVATRQLTAEFVDATMTRLEKAAVDPRLLTIEVTEEVVSPRRSGAIDHLLLFHEMGVRIAIDDFGTGGASLLSLQHLPVDALKIAPIFIEGLADSKRQAAIVEAIVGLGRALELEVIAEGVEREADLEAVRALGCDLAQGFLFSSPAPAASVDWLPSRASSL